MVTCHKNIAGVGLCTFVSAGFFYSFDFFSAHFLLWFRAIDYRLSVRRLFDLSRASPDRVGSCHITTASDTAVTGERLFVGMTLQEHSGAMTETMLSTGRVHETGTAAAAAAMRRRSLQHQQDRARRYSVNGTARHVRWSDNRRAPMLERQPSFRFSRVCASAVPGSGRVSRS